MDLPEVKKWFTLWMTWTCPRLTPTKLWLHTPWSGNTWITITGNKIRKKIYVHERGHILVCQSQYLNVYLVRVGTTETNSLRRTFTAVNTLPVWTQRLGHSRSIQGFNDILLHLQLVFQVKRLSLPSTTLFSPTIWILQQTSFLSCFENSALTSWMPLLDCIWNAHR